jgi:hypothetical protein
MKIAVLFGSPRANGNTATLTKTFIKTAEELGIDGGSYRAWYKDDHLTFRWIHGKPWTEGSIMYAEEYFHGKLHKFKFVCVP